MRSTFNHTHERGRARRLALVATLAAGVLAGCDEQVPDPVLSPEPTPAFARGGNGGTNGRILFVSDRNNPGSEEWELFSMNPDGTGVTQLTAGPAAVGQAAWSPDGKRIVFSSEHEDPDGDIYVMNADGTGVTRLTSSLGYDLQPRYSKDGKRIVFTTTRFAADPSSPATTELEVMTMSADGSDVRRLTTNLAADLDSDWSPDGKKIAFASNQRNPTEPILDIFVMDVNGNNITQLTFGGPLNRTPVWAPGGKQIAFAAESSIIVMNADGTKHTTVATGTTFEALPFWSDDGKYIAYNRDVGGNKEIFVMKADGTGVTQLTYSAGADIAVAWRR